MNRNYETDNDYILDVLEKALDESMDKLINNIPKNMQFEFAKFLAVRNQIEIISVSNAYERGICSITNKEI